ADVRWYLDGRSGREEYNKGHLPGAVFVDLDHTLAGPPSPGAGRHPLPDPATFAGHMRSLGIGDDSIVVAYDDQGGVTAARLVWMLRVTGHHAALLDGGIRSYRGVLEVGPPGDHPPVGGQLVECPWPPECVAGIDDAADPANLVIDARAPERFRGDEEPVDARPGHIPGARNLPCRSNLDQDGCFLPAEELRRRFEAVGAAAAIPVISYCGSGVTACHNLIALELAGMGPGRLYPGSWSQYSHDFSRPAEAGAGRPDQ
ncbi:MAG TPA: sulfurtransferase, partial [Acidimicrobiales bacterium]|nr:sulfurtransferase [Acidimicrobiales bacterium]